MQKIISGVNKDWLILISNRPEYIDIEQLPYSPSWG